MIAITLLLLPFNMAMYTGKGTEGLEEAGRKFKSIEDKLEPSAPPHPPNPFNEGPLRSHPSHKKTPEHLFNNGPFSSGSFDVEPAEYLFKKTIFFRFI